MATKQTDWLQVKARLKPELHEKLKERSEKEERTMNYLINKAVELLIKEKAA